MSPPSTQAATVGMPLAARARVKPNLRLLGLLALGHLVIDTNQRALPEPRSRTAG